MGLGRSPEGRTICRSRGVLPGDWRDEVLRASRLVKSQDVQADQAVSAKAELALFGAGLGSALSRCARQTPWQVGQSFDGKTGTGITGHIAAGIG